MNPFDQAWDLLKEDMSRDPSWVVGGMSDDIAFDGEADCERHVREWLVSVIGFMRNKDPSDTADRVYDFYANAPFQQLEAFLRNEPSELHQKALGMLEDCRQANLAEQTGDADSNLPPMHFSEYMRDEDEPL